MNCAGVHPLFVERPTPSTWAYANGTGEDLRQVTLICKAAGQGYIPQGQPAIAQLLLGDLDAKRQKPVVRCDSYGAAKRTREIARRQAARLSHLIEWHTTIKVGSENFLGALHFPCRAPTPDRLHQLNI
jgi:hypothetical protein